MYTAMKASSVIGRAAPASLPGAVQRPPRHPLLLPLCPLPGGPRWARLAAPIARASGGGGGSAPSRGGGGRSSSGRGGGGGGGGRGRSPARGAGRGRGHGGGGPPPGARRRPYSPKTGGGGSSGDFVVIGKAEPRYLPEDEEALAALEGGRFWADSWRAEYGEDPFDEDEDADEEEGEEAGGGFSGGAEGEDAAAEANLAAVLQALTPDLEEDGETAVQAEWRQVYTSQQLPAPRLGPVAVKRAAGKGRGLVTTAAVEEGDLLLVAAPLGVLYCDQGTTPENEELADHLATACTFTPRQLAALKRLAGPGAGTGSSSSDDGSSSGGGELALPTEKELLVGAEDGGDGGGGGAKLDTPRAELYALINANCTGEEFEDPVLCMLRGTSSCGHLGVWPAAAYVNHSCAPTAVGYAIGDRWVLRASEAMPQGAEVTVSYLGQLLAAPLAVRRVELQEKYGFECGCQRCKAEERAGEELLTLQTEVYSECDGSIGPDLEEAIEEGDGAAALNALERLRELRGRYEAAVKGAKANAKTRRWMQASVFPLYDLISLAADELGPSDSSGGGSGGGSGAPRRDRGEPQGPDTEALAECMRITASIARGTDAHLDLATEYMVRTESKFGSEHQEAVDAARACRAATRVRYGADSDLGPKLLELLIDTRAALGMEEEVSA